MTTPQVPQQLLDYYHRELSYLRQSGGEFARTHPRVAARLAIGQSESADPHVERLLESFAFLTARLQQEIDTRFPEVAEGLLQVMYPHLVQPLPACGIAVFDVDPTQGKLTTSYHVPAGTQLYAYATLPNATDPQICRFRTCYDAHLWPIQVQSADFCRLSTYAPAAPGADRLWCLRLRLSAPQPTLEQLDLDKLRLHVTGDRFMIARLMESIYGEAKTHVFLGLPGETPEVAHMVPLAPNALKPVGFLPQESLMPLASTTHPANGLLQDYFHFPAKFDFFDLVGLREGISALHQKTGAPIGQVDVLIALAEPGVVDKLHIGPENFVLGATPMINLFTRTSEPIHIDHRALSYRIVPDQTRERTTEIYSIDMITATDEGSKQAREVPSLFSFNHYQAKHLQSQLFWMARRMPSEKRDVPGHDLYVTFVDYDLNPQVPAQKIAYANLTCTNRYLADYLPEGAQLHADVAVPAGRMYCLAKPTHAVFSPNNTQYLWQLISHLGLSHRNFFGPDGKGLLKELLHIYARGQQAATEIDGIRDFVVTSATAKIGHDPWRGFVHGTSIKLTLDETYFEASNAFLFAGVLNRFFALQAPINTYTQVELYSQQRNKVWKQWPPMSGEKHLV